MMKPLALVFYEALLPGRQLVNRLEELGYEAATHTQAATLAAEARRTKPFVLIIDLAARQADLCAVIRELKATEETSHIPVLAFANDGREELRAAAHEAGATLVAGDAAVLAHLPLLLERALEVEL